MARMRDDNRSEVGPLAMAAVAKLRSSLELHFADIGVSEVQAINQRPMSLPTSLRPVTRSNLATRCVKLGIGQKKVHGFCTDFPGECWFLLAFLAVSFRSRLLKKLQKWRFSVALNGGCDRD